jgi:hypothetical protein
VECDLNRSAQRAPLPWPVRAATATAAKELVENASAATAATTEDVTELREDVLRVKAGAATRAALNTGVTELVISLSLFCVGQDAVGLGSLFEFVGRAIFFIAVGVILHRKFAISTFDIGATRIAGDAEDFVVIALRQRKTYLGNSTCDDFVIAYICNQSVGR